MSIDFGQPQRQSAAGILISGAYTLQQFVRAMFIPLALLIFKSNKTVLLYTAFGLTAILVISLIYGYFYYRKFTFYLDTLKQEFVIDKGVFGRKNLTIPVEKIQQVNINQSLIHGALQLSLQLIALADERFSLRKFPCCKPRRPSPRRSACDRPSINCRQPLPTTTRRWRR